MGSDKFGTCPCTALDILGTCECGHASSAHEGINGRFETSTPCSGTKLGPATFSGNVQRTMQCTCVKFHPAPVTQEVSA